MDKRLEGLPRQEALPDALLRPDGSRAETAEEWAAQRAHWQEQITRYMLGTAPESRGPVRGEVTASHVLYDGEAVFENVRIAYGPEFAFSFDVGIVRPNRAGRFAAITWNLFETAFEKPCPVEREAATRGYMLAGFDRVQLMHDGKGDRQDAKEAYPGHDWGAVRIWALGHSLLADYLVTRGDVDPDRLVAAGHSRGGKAALAAAAYDERFAVCAPVNSGSGGAGCFRILGDRTGKTQDSRTVESMGRIGHVFPHWWNEAFLAFGADQPPYALANEACLPFDLHILKDLVAPRGLITCEGLDDAWANPYGSHVTWQAAQRVFDLLGAPQNNAIFYREGGHVFGAEDWHAILDFCDEVLYGRKTAHGWNNAPFGV